MNPVRYSQIAEWCGGALIQGVPSATVCKISTDTRKIEEGDLFLALKGDQFDAHNFLDKAEASGCSGLLVHTLNETTENFEGTIIHVKNTLTALQKIAFGYRRSLGNLRVVGVTGSNGKTSTKDFLRGVYSKAGGVNATKGNLNNHIGLPLTILDTDDSHQTGVWEMGMNHPGEIEVLAEIAKPVIAVVTNVGTAHIEHMKTREAIALEKTELPMALSAEGTCIMPVGDDYYDFVKERIPCEMVSVGLEHGDVQASDIQIVSGGKTSFQLTFPDVGKARVEIAVRGRHMVMNALLAAASGWKSGLSIEEVAEGLGSVELTGGRLQEKEVAGLRFLDDSYNANPDSMRAALNTLGEFEVSGRRIAVLGMMGELGEHEEKEHLSLGSFVGAGNVDLLITVGSVAAAINQGAGDLIEHMNFSSHEEAGHFLRENSAKDDLILLKGSRSARMETILLSLN